MHSSKEIGRLRRKKRIRKKLYGTSQRPRLALFKSLKHIYAQIIDDAKGHTLVSASSQSKGFQGQGGNIEGAKKVGELLFEKMKQTQIQAIVFDRSGYSYHGRVKALAETLREKGINF